jgi:Ni,Fe-hydrogenase III small subunit
LFKNQEGKMSNWVFKGLTTGIKTTLYPSHEEISSGVSPGLPRGGKFTEYEANLIVSRCLNKALKRENTKVVVDNRRCIHSFRCLRGITPQIDWQPGYEWAMSVSEETDPKRGLGEAFKNSAHILVVDAGDCGACLNEINQLDNPYYNMHRLGFFITPTPRDADILMVVGPVTVHMRRPLLKAYNAMPTPKRVIAVGTCALTGGVFGPSFTSSAGVADVLPVDVEVPGNPPPPLAILHGLLVAVGRKSSALPIWPEDAEKEVKIS